jgi:hypothetical protein
MRIRTGRFFAFALATLVTCVAPHSHGTKQMRRGASLEARPQAAAPMAREVRLRKLHLVRPDLISYPLALEVYC